MSYNVTVVTPWRDGMRQMSRYMDRVHALDWPRDNLRVVHVEGDSTDGTYHALKWWADSDSRQSVVTCNTGKPRYPSIVNAERFQILATVFNAGIDAVDYEWTDYALFVPCDIRYDADLIKRLVAHGVDLVSPFVFQHGVFYDIWAFSREGRNFGPHAERIIPELFGNDLLSMDTIGGVMLMDADVLRAGVRYSMGNVDRGLCEAARAKGFTVWADPTLHVYHGE